MIDAIFMMELKETLPAPANGEPTSSPTDAALWA